MDTFKVNMTFLCYESLIRSLPKALRDHPEKTVMLSPNIPFKINMVMNKDKFVKYSYSIFIAARETKNAKVNQRLKDK